MRGGPKATCWKMPLDLFAVAARTVRWLELSERCPVERELLHPPWSKGP
jgi:hypothetical protein